MREVLLVKQLYQSYEKLNLKRSKLFLALFLMICTAVLEMAGLSILYPLILIVTKFEENKELLFSLLPYSINVQIMLLLGSTAVLFIVKNLALYFSYRYNIRFAGYYYHKLIQGLYASYIYKPLLEFKEESSGTLTNIICVQSSRLIDGIIRPLLVITSELFILIAITSMVLFVCPEFLITTILVCGSAASVFYLLLRSKVLTWGKTRMDSASLLHELVNNSSNGIAEIKIFEKESFLENKIREASNLEINMFQKLEMYQQIPRFLIETLFVISILLFLLFSLITGSELPTTFAKFSVIAACSFRILPSINRLVNSYSSFSFGIEPAIFLMKLIFKLNLTHYTNIKKENSTIKTAEANKTLYINELAFRYPSSETNLLKNVNLNIKMGEHIGIIGESGSGKSTFIKIIAGLYIPTSGSIRFGEDNIFEASDWKKNIAYVPQEPFILPGTIRDNIAFGADFNLSDNDITEVLEMVGLSEFIKSFDKGLNTIVGEKGILLSGGQKQLLCLARILFRKPRILLLDEPTAALDSKNENIVLSTIDKLFSQTTIIMVSHKRYNFTAFDSIYSCKNGNILKADSLQKPTMIKEGEKNVS